MAKRVIWSPEARSDIRAVDRHTALRILKAVARFLKAGSGDVKPLEDFHPPLFRLRIGGWRFIYRNHDADSIEAVRVRKRGEAYR